MSRRPAAITVELSRDELLLINNAVNEVVHGIELPAFATRIGASEAEALTLLQQVGSVLDGLE